MAPPHRLHTSFWQLVVLSTSLERYSTVGQQQFADTLDTNASPSKRQWRQLPNLPLATQSRRNKYMVLERWMNICGYSRSCLLCISLIGKHPPDQIVQCSVEGWCFIAVSVLRSVLSQQRCFVFTRATLLFDKWHATRQVHLLEEKVQMAKLGRNGSAIMGVASITLAWCSSLLLLLYMFC